MVILVGLGLVGGCQCPSVGPCLEVGPPEAQPCLSMEEIPIDVPVHPCLSEPAPEHELGTPDVGAVGPCLEVAPPEVTPCLSPPADPDPPVGPCLKIAAPRDDRPEPAPELESKSGIEGGMARRDAVERFAQVLPEDVVRRLRGRSSQG